MNSSVLDEGTDLALEHREDRRNTDSIVSPSLIIHPDNTTVAKSTTMTGTGAI